MTSPGSVVVGVPAGAATDLAGNPNTAAAGATVTYAGGMFAVGVGAGAGSRVDVYNGTGQMVSTTSALDSSFTGGNRVAVGDVTGDGVPDYVMGTGPGASTLVKVIDGATRKEVLAFAPFEASPRSN